MAQMTHGSQLQKVLGSTAFKEDSITVASLSDAQALEIADKIKAFTGFLDKEKLNQIIVQVVSEEKQQKATFRFIRNLHKYLYDLEVDLAEYLSNVETALQSNFESTADFPIEKVKLRARELIVNATGIHKQLKAEELAYQHASDVDDIKIICDIRPIFDEDRKEMLGAVVVNTLHIQCSEDRFPKTLELSISKSQLIELQSSVSRALSKVGAIDDFCARVELEVASVDGEGG